MTNHITPPPRLNRTQRVRVITVRTADDLAAAYAAALLDFPEPTGTTWIDPHTGSAYIGAHRSIPDTYGHPAREVQIFVQEVQQ